MVYNIGLSITLNENEIHSPVFPGEVVDGSVVKFVICLELQKKSFLNGHQCQSSQAIMSSTVSGMRLDALHSLSSIDIAGNFRS